MAFRRRSSIDGRERDRIRDGATIIRPQTETPGAYDTAIHTSLVAAMPGSRVRCPAGRRPARRFYIHSTYPEVGEVVACFSIVLLGGPSRAPCSPVHARRARRARPARRASHRMRDQSPDWDYYWDMGLLVAMSEAAVARTATARFRMEAMLALSVAAVVLL